MKRFFAGAAAAWMAVALLIPVKTEAVSARRAYVLDAVSGRELFSRNEDQRSLIASTTKIMTALIICEQCNVLDRMRIPKEAVGIEGSSMYLKEGEVLTLQELLYGLMLSSGNDAAVALAIYCGGTVEGFAEMMNDKAKAEQAAREKAQAQEFAEKLKDITVELSGKAGTGGRLFGSITNQEIADALQKEHGITLDKRKIVLDEQIKTVGLYTVRCKLGYEITA